MRGDFAVFICTGFSARHGFNDIFWRNLHPVTASAAFRYRNAPGPTVKSQ